MSSETIEVRLAVLTERIEQTNRLLSQNIIDHKDMLDRHDRILMGNNGDPGLMRKMDGVIEREADRRWHFRTLWASVVAMMAKVVFDSFRR